MTTDKFILKGKVPVPCADLYEWGKWLETANRVVEKTTIDGVDVSTVFLGLDHSFGEGPPLLFETMIFGGQHDQWCNRCSTWEEAEAMHKTACAMIHAKGETNDK